MKRFNVALVVVVLLSIVAGDVFGEVRYTVTGLGTLGGIYTRSSAVDINNNGQVVGRCYPDDYSRSRPFLYSSGAMTDLDTVGGTYSMANAINNSGQVVGSFGSSGYTQPHHAFLYSGSTTTDLGTLGGRQSFANGINNSGQVVGHSYTSGDTYHAFLYNGSVMTDLGTPGGIQLCSHGGFDINNTGQIVGSIYDTTFECYPSLYSEGKWTDLNTLIDPGSSWTLTAVEAINDFGWIVGSGISADGQHQAILLTPVPEPSLLVLMGIAAANLLRRRREV